jgi:plastocyanin
MGCCGPEEGSNEMKTFLKLTLAAAFIVSGTMASAVEHVVLMQRSGFFPDKIYVQVGDTIRFENRTPSWAYVYSDDADDNLSGYNANNPCPSSNKRYNGAKDGFSSGGWMSVGSSYTVKVTSCIETVLLPPYIYRYSFNTNQYRGTIIVGTPPLHY